MEVFIYICSKKASKSSSNIHPSTTTLVSLASFGVHTERSQRAPRPQSLLILTLSGSLLFSELLAAGDSGLDADAAEHEGDAHPLLGVEAVAVVHDGQDHGEHLAGHGDGDQGDGPEVGDGVDWFCAERCQQKKRREVGGK